MPFLLAELLRCVGWTVSVCLTEFSQGSGVPLIFFNELMFYTPRNVVTSPQVSV